MALENLRDIVPWKATVKANVCFEVVVNGNYCICTAVLERTAVVIDEATAATVLVPMDKVWVNPADVEPLIERLNVKQQARRNHSASMSKGNHSHHG